MGHSYQIRSNQSHSYRYFPKCMYYLNSLIRYINNRGSINYIN